MENLNILCFGDSLTVGYSAWGTIHTPYANNMKIWLESALDPTKVTVEVNGRSGDMVNETSGNFLYRINSSCTRTKQKFDWIVILGGTNDIGMGKNSNDTFSSLKKVYDCALHHGANVLAMTVPECAVKSQTIDDRRNLLNDLIKEYRPIGFEERFHTLDLFALMPYHALTDEEQADIWDDGLHFTPHGYEVLGDHVAQRLMDLLEEAETRDKPHVS